MSLLSENSITVFEATNGLYAEAIQAELFQGKVSVGNAVLQVPTTYLAGANAVYTIPLTIPIPKGALVFKVIFDVAVTFATSNANTISIGLNTVSDLSAAVPLATWVQDAIVVNAPDFVATNSYSELQVQVQGAGSLTAGKLTAKVFFI